MVLVSLADCCEAAIRSVLMHGEKPSGMLIRNKVEELVHSRIIDHQLDKARLTTADLSKVIDSMVESFCVMYHQRPVYEKIEGDGEATTKTVAPAEAPVAAPATSEEPGQAPRKEQDAPVEEARQDDGEQ